MASKKAPAKLPTLTLKKSESKLEMPVDTGITASESVDVDQPIKETDYLKSPVIAPDTVSAVVKGRKEMEITSEMVDAIAEAKRSIKDKMKKSEAAREVFDMLKGHERKQIVHVFIEGCGLSKAGASTYYQNCKK